MSDKQEKQETIQIASYQWDISWNEITLHPLTGFAKIKDQKVWCSFYLEIPHLELRLWEMIFGQETQSQSYPFLAFDTTQRWSACPRKRSAVCSTVGAAIQRALQRRRVWKARVTPCWKSTDGHMWLFMLMSRTEEQTGVWHWFSLGSGMCVLQGAESPGHLRLGVGDSEHDLSGVCGGHQGPAFGTQVAVRKTNRDTTSWCPRVPGTPQRNCRRPCSPRYRAGVYQLPAGFWSPLFFFFF